MRADDPRHGTTRGYHAGCRQACCRAAMARYEKAGRLARLSGGRAVPAIGAKRRLQALMRLGWSSHAIAAAAGLAHRNHVWRIVNGQKGRPTVWVQKSTDQWVRRVYDELSMTVPTGRYVERTRAHAERMGWPPPLAWEDIDDPHEIPAGAYTERRASDDIDPVVVQRILNGERLKSTAAEKAEALRQWRETGRPVAELERVLGIKAERYSGRVVAA